MVVISEVIKREEEYSKEAFLGERNYKNHKYLVRLVLVLQNRLYPVSWPIRKKKKKCWFGSVMPSIIQPTDQIIYRSKN